MSYQDLSINTVVLFVGIPASGKSTFYHRYFSDSFARVNLDTLHTRSKEQSAIESCFANGKSFVVDNTNLTKEVRQKYISMAKSAGYRMVAYCFQSSTRDCLARNAERTGKAKVPNAIMASMARKLEPPDKSEGFDLIYSVCIADNEFVVKPMKEDC